MNFLKHGFSLPPPPVRRVHSSNSSKEATLSINLSKFFESLSASVSHLIDHRHEYLRKTKEKLSHLTGLTSNRPMPFRQVKLTYPSWFQSRQKLARQWSFPSQQRQFCSTKSSYAMNKMCSMIKFFDQY